MPQRFFLSAPGRRRDGSPIPVEDCESGIVILSRADPPFTCIEHQWENQETGRWDCFEICPQQVSVGCPKCAENNRPAFKMFLTCLEVKDRIWVDGNGKERISKFRKKMLDVPEKQHKLFDEVLMERGTLRGLVLHAKRSTREESKIGVLTIVDFISESDIVSNFGKRPTDIEEYDFPALFPTPDVNDLIKKYGGAPVPGSMLDEAFDYLNTMPKDHIPY